MAKAKEIEARRADDALHSAEQDVINALYNIADNGVTRESEIALATAISMMYLKRDAKREAFSKLRRDTTGLGYPPSWS